MVGKFSIKPVFMHDPITFLPFGSSSAVEDQSLLHSNKSASLGAVDLPVFSGGLPVAGVGGSVGPQSGRVFPVP